MLRGLLAAASRDEVLTRYRVGAVLCDLKRAPGTYGERAIESVAAEVGVAATTLYRYLAVAENWSDAEIAAQSAKTNRFGQTLTWSHFVALSKAPDEALRRALLDACLANAWSARELTQRVDARASGTRPSSDAGCESPVRAALKEGIQSAARAAIEVGIFSDALSERISDPGTEVDHDLVARAIEAFQDLLLRAETTLAQLQGAGGSENRLRATPSSRMKVAERALETPSDEEEAEGSASKPRSARVRRPVE